MSFYQASSDGKLDAVLQHGANVLSWDGRNWTSLHHTSSGGNLESGEDADARSAKQMTYMWYPEGGLKAALLLREHSDNLCATTSRSWAPVALGMSSLGPKLEYKIFFATGSESGDVITRVRSNKTGK